jgi:hypothetical protein
MPFTPPTLLGLSGDGFDLSDYSLRGLTATLEPIAQTAQIVRDVNGNLLNLRDPIFDKYRVTISCTDQESPGFAGITTDDPNRVWPGSLVTVTLLPHLGAEEPLVLNMMVVAPWRESFDEWAHDNSWQLELEEV